MPSRAPSNLNIEHIAQHQQCPIHGSRQALLPYISYQMEALCLAQLLSLQHMSSLSMALKVEQAKSSQKMPTLTLVLLVLDDERCHRLKS